MSRRSPKAPVSPSGPWRDGCGGRGSGAAKQALSTQGKVKLIAMADVFRDRLDGSYKELMAQGDLKSRIDVPEDRKFDGFDAYQKAIDAGPDLVILATPPGFRPLHFEAAVKAGYRWDSTLTAEFAVAADVNPGVGNGYDATLPTENSAAAAMQKANSPNHQGAG